MIQNKELFYIVEYLKKYDPIQYSLIKFVNNQNGSGEIFQQPDNTTIGYLTFLQNNIYSCFTYWTKLSMGEPLILTGNTFLFIDTKLSSEHKHKFDILYPMCNNFSNELQSTNPCSALIYKTCIGSDNNICLFFLIIDITKVADYDWDIDRGHRVQQYIDQFANSIQSYDDIKHYLES